MDHNKSFLFCLSPAEHRRLTDLAQGSGLSAGEVLRRLLRQAAIVQTVGLRDNPEGRREDNAERVR
jgi:hypothetical protein